MYALWNKFGSFAHTGAAYGSHEAYWLANFDYHQEMSGVTGKTDKLAGWFELAKSCGWIIAYPGVCYASERPSMVKLDCKMQPHCEDGPAIKYPDGWSVYADHGVYISKKIVMDPSGYTAQTLKKLNTERIKIVLRKLGVEKFMSVCGTTSNTWTDLFSQIAKETVSD